MCDAFGFVLCVNILWALHLALVRSQLINGSFSTCFLSFESCNLGVCLGFWFLCL